MPGTTTMKTSSSKNENENETYGIDYANYKEEPWKVIESYFSGTHLQRPVRHQIESYNDFVQVQIRKQLPCLIRYTCVPNKIWCLKPTNTGWKCSLLSKTLEFIVHKSTKIMAQPS